MAIHPTAVVDAAAEIGPDVEIGPYVVIEGPVKIGAGSRIMAHAFLNGDTTLGPECIIHPFAVVGNTPQDYHYHGEDSHVRLGSRTVVREYATIHRGSQPGSGTTIGDDCMIMAKAHIGHNCAIGNGVIISNSTEVAGHSQIGDNAVLSGHIMVHQFVRIGRRSMCAATAKVPHDIPPFMLVDFDGAAAKINLVGLRRGGFSREAISALKEAYRLLYRGESFKNGLAALQQQNNVPEVEELIAFLTAPSKRGIAGRPRPRPGTEEPALDELM